MNLVWSDLDDAVDPRRWENIQKIYEFERCRVDETMKQHSELTADLFAKESVYLTECMTETAKLNQLVIPVLVAARRELELPVSVDTYTQLFEKGSRASEDHMREFLQSAQKFITDQTS
jgi:hypothetical protein